MGNDLNRHIKRFRAFILKKIRNSARNLVTTRFKRLSFEVKARQVTVLNPPHASRGVPCGLHNDEGIAMHEEPRFSSLPAGLGPCCRSNTYVPIGRQCPAAHMIEGAPAEKAEAVASAMASGRMCRTPR